MRNRNPHTPAPAVLGVCLAFLLCALLLAPSTAAPAGPGRTFRRGVEAFQAQRHKEAKRLFEQAVSENPADPLAYYYLGLAEQRLGEHEQAVRAFRRALELDKNLDDAHLPLGISLFHLKRHEEARLQFSDTLRSDPTNASAHLFLGLIYMERKKYPIAQPHLEQAASDPSLAPAARLNLGNIAMQLHQDEKARREFKEVLSLDPKGSLADSARQYMEALARQEKAQRPWKLEAEAGFEHSDNVTRIEADQVTNEADYAAVLSAAGSYRFFRSNGTTATAGYSVYQQLYDKVSSQDFQSHTGELTLYKAFEAWEVGGEYSFNYNFLNGDDFLQIQTATARLHYFPEPRFFTQISYSFQQKVFFQDTDRDALAHLAGVNQFLFFGDFKGFVLLGVQYENENARAGEFDFQGYTASATLRVPLAKGLVALVPPGLGALLPPDLSIEGGFSYHKKDFTKETPSIGKERTDDVRTYKLALRCTLVDGLKATVQYKYTNSGSNLASVNYTENDILVLLTYRF